MPGGLHNTGRNNENKIKIMQIKLVMKGRNKILQNQNKQRFKYLKNCNERSGIQKIGKYSHPLFHLKNRAICKVCSIHEDTPTQVCSYTYTHTVHPTCLHNKFIQYLIHTLSHQSSSQDYKNKVMKYRRTKPEASA